MLSYANTKLNTFLRTKGSLLMVVRRHMRKNHRAFEKLTNQTLPKLTEEKASGDVDALDEDVTDAEDIVESVVTDTSESESKTLIAQDRVLQHLADVIGWFKKVEESSEMKEFIVAHPEKGQELQTMVREEGTALHKILSSDHDLLKDEYNLLERAHENKEGTVQGIVVTALNKEQELHDTLFDERGLTRKTDSDEDAVEDDFKDLLRDLKDSDPAKVHKEVEKIKSETKKLREHFIEMLKGFLRILSVTVFLWFHYRKEGEGPLKKFLQELQDAGYPPKDLEELNKHLSTIDAEIQKDASATANVARRSFNLHMRGIPGF